MGKDYLVKFNWTFRIAPEEWEVQSVEKMFDENTTLKEIKEWQRRKTIPNPPAGDKLFEVKISEPE